MTLIDWEQKWESVISDEEVVLPELIKEGLLGCPFGDLMKKDTSIIANTVTSPKTTVTKTKSGKKSFFKQMSSPNYYKTIPT